MEGVDGAVSETRSHQVTTGRGYAYLTVNEIGEAERLVTKAHIIAVIVGCVRGETEVVAVGEVRKGKFRWSKEGRRSERLFDW